MSKRTFYILCVIKNQKFFKKGAKILKNILRPSLCTTYK